ncbi:hypothetical protein BUALT_Bualt09G0082100 [Buddleja alternifolia]|uniref:Uncharacterized protein n=1 Tax=Buddleja alternifolia TaxID=168488 RepID=A0AAV6X7K1_9LAMI|nr:hypothetical protein BUALT_Bualt09G0082100 [Buddleja alternifolia]
MYYTITNYILYQLIMQEVELRKGPWLEEEDEKLSAAVAVLGNRRWDSLAKASGLRRSGKSCRLRWMNYLRPNLKHGHISVEEERVIIELHEKWGNKWSRIAQRLPGRTDNEIKNYWKSYLRKKSLAMEKEFLSSINLKASKNTSLRSECETASPCSINGECFLFKDDDSVLGPSDDSTDALDLLSLTQSPYEARLTEWMTNCPHDISKLEPKDGLWNFDIYYPEERISDEFSSSIWDYSLWDGE